MNLQPLLIEFIKNRELLNFVVGIRIFQTPSLVVLGAPFTNSFFFQDLLSRLRVLMSRDSIIFENQISMYCFFFITATTMNVDGNNMCTMAINPN